MPAPIQPISYPTPNIGNLPPRFPAAGRNSPLLPPPPPAPTQTAPTPQLPGNRTHASSGNVSFVTPPPKPAPVTPPYNSRVAAFLAFRESLTSGRSKRALGMSNRVSPIRPPIVINNYNTAASPAPVPVATPDLSSFGGGSGGGSSAGADTLGAQAPSSGFDLGSFMPFILIGGGVFVVLHFLKKKR
jgi:hypothetical protein